MNWIERIWTGVDRAWSALQVRTKSIATRLATWQNEQPSYSPMGFEHAVRDGYKKNELIFACVTKTANTASSICLDVYSNGGDGDGEDEELEDHPLAKLLKQPNPFYSQYDFWYYTVTCMKLAGCAYWEKVRSRAGQVVELWPLRPDYVHPIKSSTTFIAGYEYAPPDLPPVRLAAQDVLEFKLPDPLNLWGSVAPVMVAARVGDIDNATTDFLKLFFEHGGMPMGILSSKMKLQDADVTRNRARWAERYGGMENWLQPAILDSDATFQRISFSFQEMGFDSLDSRDEARICMALEVPPIIVGAKIGLDRATYSNYEQARKAWWEDTLVPLYRHLADKIQEDLVSEYTDDIYVEWDFEDVPALQDDADATELRARGALTAGAITVNEYREMIGHEAAEDGDIYLRSIATLVVPLGMGDVQSGGYSQDTGDEEADSQDEEATVQGQEDSEDTQGQDEAMMQEGGKSAKAAAVAPDDEERRRHERRLEKAMADYFTAQVPRIEQAVSGNAPG